MTEYVNKIKLQRAIASLPSGATEAEIREAYVRMGGLLIEEESSPEVVVKAEGESLIAKVKKAVKKKK